MSTKARKPITYVEEEFGILTDDELYIDCILIKPKGLKDEDLQVLRVWVPKFPMTKASTINCARQEVQSYGTRGKIAHLVFDLRSTGDSEGNVDDTDFEIDLRSIRAWADERFGDQVNFGFLGTPDLSYGRVSMLPLRPGVIMETYFHPCPANKEVPTILYLASFGNFDRIDEARCIALARLGYDVYGLDPMRYLLHASLAGPLTVETLKQDIETVSEIIATPPYLIGMPIAAGLSILWGGASDKIRGVIAVGRAKLAFRAKHIFDLEHDAQFELTQYAGRIAPRPIALVWHDGHAMGGDRKEMMTLFKSTGQPNRVERAQEVSPAFLQALLKWQQEFNT